MKITAKTIEINTIVSKLKELKLDFNIKNNGNGDFLIDVKFNPICNEFAIILIWNYYHAFYCCDIIPAILIEPSIDYKFLIQNIETEEYSTHTKSEVLEIIDENIINSGIYLSTFVEALKPQNSFVGDLNQRLTFANLNVVEIIKTPTKFGIHFVYKLQDENYNFFQWSTGDYDLKLGSFYSIIGTVKSHEIIDGYKITMISNCTVKD